MARQDLAEPAGALLGLGGTWEAPRYFSVCKPGGRPAEAYLIPIQACSSLGWGYPL